jgi:hypothetical protein
VSEHQPTDQPGGDGQGGSPFTRPGFLISAGVVLIIVVLAGFLVFTGGDDDSPSTAPATGPATSATSSSPQSGPADSGSCDLPADDQTVPVAAPNTEWTLVGTVAAPSSDEAGPAVTDPTTDVRSCYAQTPTGALFAAANFLAATSDPALIEAAIDELAATGPGRDTALEAIRTDPQSVIGTGSRYQIAGFTFLSYTEDVATISLAIAATGGLAGVPLTVVWEDGDWKVDLPADGNPAGQAGPISSLAGYVPWAGA